jgi:hypothetical protein
MVAALAGAAPIAAQQIAVVAINTLIIIGPFCFPARNASPV